MRGAAGLGLIALRLHQSLAEPVLADVARSWFATALDLGIPDEPGFDGAAGVGLALLAASTMVDPTWDRVMLLS